MKKMLILSLGFVLFGSCEIDDLNKIDLLNLDNGAYMRTISPTAANMAFLKTELGTASLTFTVEAVDPDRGAQFGSYDLAVEFRDRTASNGNNSVALKNLKSIAPTGFTTDPTSGYLRGTFTISSAEIMTALGVTADKVSVGDSFDVFSTLVTKDGRKFSDKNTDPDILGGAFYNSPFYYRLNIK
ncbi:MAG TPA: hypothetical protein PKM27_06570 [Saprospiraceae bacterium]|nr:hypothetical protein [Saprospiraceae bacterium]HNT20134.1 hypothetical protein [Saprospiraceae bacterium]